jgi:lysozyme family protein
LGSTLDEGGTMGLENENVEGIINRLLSREGGYVESPHDIGGCTNFGITRGGWELVMHFPITCEELRLLTRHQATQFYQRWGSLNGIWPVAEVSPYLCEVLFDTSVLFGPGRAIRWMQLEAGAEDDGIIGPETMKQIQVKPERIAHRLIGRRVMHHAFKVKTDRTQVVFLMGWMERCVNLLRMG